MLDLIKAAWRTQTCNLPPGIELFSPKVLNYNLTSLTTWGSKFCLVMYMVGPTGWERNFLVILPSTQQHYSMPFI